MSTLKWFTVEVLAFQGKDDYVSLGITTVQSENLKGARHAAMDELWDSRLDSAGCWAEFRIGEIVDAVEAPSGAQCSR